MTDAQVVELCARAGLRLAGVSRRRGVLLLAPTSFDDLPTPEELTQLGATLTTATKLPFVALDLEDLP